ncbi:MAG: hypothetical protein WCE30_04640, partial [Mycobacterium sp.]
AGPARGVPRWLIAVLLVALAVGYGLTVLLTQGLWNKDAPATSAHATFAALPLAGESATPEELTTTGEVLRNRVGHLGGRSISVSVAGDTVEVGATGVTEDQLRAIAEIGRLQIRPVIHTIEAHPDASAGPTKSAAPATDQAIQDEKALRQSTNPQIQLLALQFQGTRCGQPDALADNDDPNLPLVTCSRDGKQVYVLEKSIMAGDQIRDASWRWDQQHGQYVVDLQFNDAATATWATFTRNNVGAQVGFTVDSQVLSAPTIREAISGGRAQIGGQVDADSARALAAVVGDRPLPVGLAVQSVRVVALDPPFWTIPRMFVAAGGILVAVVVIVGLLVLARRRRV